MERMRNVLRCFVVTNVFPAGKYSAAFAAGVKNLVRCQQHQSRMKLKRDYIQNKKGMLISNAHGKEVHAMPGSP